jgi:hypothetical protein
VALGVILFGGGILCAYEAYSVATGKDPTISKIVSYHFETRPRLCALGAFIAGGVIVGLLVHFLNWRSA